MQTNSKHKEIKMPNGNGENCHMSPNVYEDAFQFSYFKLKLKLDKSLQIKNRDI